MKRRVCVFTGTRAEYGLLRPLMRLITKERKYELQLLVSGMHLSKEFGNTYKEIEKDGFRISEKVKMLIKSDSAAGVSHSTGLGLIGCGEALNRLKPDLIFILGDRFEALAAATAALFAKIPVAHIGGGEATYGLFDEAIRHAITKMSLLHFTSTEEYRQRVIQLGEDPGRVFNVGATGIDNIKEMKLLVKLELEGSLDFSLESRYIVVTFHPVTLEKATSEKQFTELLRALDSFPDLKIIFTYPNADTDGRPIIRLVNKYVSRNPHKAKAFVSLGQLRYLSALKHAAAVVGNSSSGIIEAPSLAIPTVNIGDRQKGRIRARSIINCAPTKTAIIAAMNKAFSPSFSAVCRKAINPYGNGHASKQIMRILSGFDWDNFDLKKEFFDMRGVCV